VQNDAGKSVAATLGPVSEPYIILLPYQKIFFGYLAQGYLTLTECYMISTPYLSWQMVLIVTRCIVLLKRSNRF